MFYVLCFICSIFLSWPCWDFLMYLYFFLVRLPHRPQLYHTCLVSLFLPYALIFHFGYARHNDRTPALWRSGHLQKGKELVLLRLRAFVLPRPVYQLLQGVASECSIIDDKNAEHRSGNLGISKPRLHSARLSTSVASDVLTTSGRREAAPE